MNQNKLNRIERLQNTEYELKQQGKLAKYGNILANCSGVGSLIAAAVFLCDKNYDDGIATCLGAAMLFLIAHNAKNSHTEYKKRTQRIHKRLVKLKKQNQK